MIIDLLSMKKLCVFHQFLVDCRILQMTYFDLQDDSSVAQHVSALLHFMAFQSLFFSSVFDSCARENICRQRQEALQLWKLRSRTLVQTLLGSEVV